MGGGEGVLVRGMTAQVGLLADRLELSLAKPWAIYWFGAASGPRT